MSEETASGRGIAGLVGALGWLVAMAGAALLGYGIYLLIYSNFDIVASGPLVAGAAITFSVGLLCVVNATIAKAMIVAANNTARLSAGGIAAGSVTDPTTGEDDLPPLEDTSQSDDQTTAPAEEDNVADGETSAQQRFEPAPYAPSQPPPPIVPDTSDPRSWPLAIDEFNVDGHLAMTLEDGTIAVETPVGWRRLPNLDLARTWLAQQPR